MLWAIGLIFCMEVNIENMLCIEKFYSNPCMHTGPTSLPAKNFENWITFSIFIWVKTFFKSWINCSIPEQTPITLKFFICISFRNAALLFIILAIIFGLGKLIMFYCKQQKKIAREYEARLANLRSRKIVMDIPLD